MKRLRIAVAALTTLAAASVLAQSGPKPEDYVTARKGLMQLQRLNKGATGGLKGGAVTPEAAAAAANLAALSQMLPLVLVEGTDSEKLAGKTRAKPDLWANMADVKDRIAKLQAETKKLAAAGAKKDAAAFAAADKDLGDVCKGCHDKYRAEQ